MAERDKYLGSQTWLFMENLLNGRFAEVFDEEEFEEFKSFLEAKAKKAGRFALAFPTTDSKTVWVSYKIDEQLSNNQQVVIELSPEVHLTDEPVQPDELSRIPVWRHVEKDYSNSRETPPIN